MLDDIVAKSQVRGPVIHDARIAALCITHGVRKLLTADREFSRFAQLTCENPFAA